MEQLYFKEIFEYPIKEFREHLETASNERIIFSGKYGIGKTRFLEDFFKQEINLNKYDVYRIFPVNYSISQNQDIIRYIKYDIIIELLQKKATIEEFDLRYIDTLPEYVKKNLFKVVAGIISMIPKVGKDLSDSLEKINKLKEKFIDFHNKNYSSPGDIVVDYLEKLEIQEGGLYEDDIITRIICDTIGKGLPKESILIVDDIDRLDPEHVFRILNVFAAHFDRPSYSRLKNKFNFDKIIIVCDFHNIRNLFHHRYGVDVDFMGYIDKFFSSEIYYFDNKKAIFKILDKIFNSISYKLLEGESESGIGQLYFRNEFVQRICVLLLDRSYISLRNIINLSGRHINYHYEKINFGKDYDIDSFRVPLTMQLKVLRDVLGDCINMQKIFKQCLKNNEVIEHFENYFGYLIYILSFNIHNFSNGRKDVDFTYQNKRMLIEVDSGFISYQVKGIIVYEYKESANGTPDRGNRFFPTIEMFWSALIDAITRLNQWGYLK